MKKTLSVLAVLGIVSFAGVQSANAFDWSNLNPAYWGHCPKCEKKKPDCSCKKQKCDPCQTGAAAPCDPCAKKQKCDPCQKKQKCDPCEKVSKPCPVPSAAAPCDPCKKEVTQPKPCDACDRLQEMNK